jgi:hypothetical protein
MNPGVSSYVLGIVAVSNPRESFWRTGSEPIGSLPERIGGLPSRSRRGGPRRSRCHIHSHYSPACNQLLPMGADQNLKSLENLNILLI